MGYLIDTCVLIQTERTQKTLQDFFLNLKEEPIGLSVISAAELLHGIHRAKDAKTKYKRSAFVETILEKIPIYPFDLKMARIYAELWANLKKSAVNIDTHDLLIGACALALDFSVVTFDRRDFSRIPGLKTNFLK
ncbi:MAG: PIN domain-containing protein [Deltaproteobacteria bacterium]|nr:PIN domain-containing protein [Deltaproteobacteria bacterium]